MAETGVMERAPQPELDDGYEEETDEAREAELRAERLNAFGMSLAGSRSEAIGDRQVSGIEEIWREDQEFYEGVDDLNRGDERTLRTDKPPQGGGSGLTKSKKQQSRVFPNITGPFVDAASAHISDILLPTEHRPWSFEPTPIPEIDELAEQFGAENPELAGDMQDESSLADVEDPAEAPQRAMSEALDDANQDQAEGTTPEQAFRQKEIAKAAAEATQNRVWDWHIECQFNAEVRKVIEDASRLGTGVLKGPVPVEEPIIGWRPEHNEQDELDRDFVVDGGIRLETRTKPTSRRIDPRNLFPAPGCGDDIQNGDYIWERDFMTTRQLRRLMLDDTYIPDQIVECLKEGPMRAVAEVEEPSSVTGDNVKAGKFEVWIRHGTAEREDLEAAGCDCEDIPEEQLFIDCMIVMVNNRVIKASLPTTDYTGFPYDVFCWRKRAHYWAGIGVGRQIRTAQKIVVGATRAMMNNAGLAGGPMIVFKQGVVRPADGVAGIAPRKVFYIKKDDQTIADATKAIGAIKVDIMVNEMMAIINYGLQMAEDNSGFPMLIQGQMGKAPDRVGVVNVLDKNTNAIKRRLARNFSDDVMTPHLRRYYVYHLMYGPDNEKGDLRVNVKGYASLVERDIQNQELGQMYAIAQNPLFGIDPKKWVDEYLKSRHLDPESLKFDDEEWEQMVSNWAAMQEAAAQDWRVEVAKINQQGRLQGIQMKGEYDGAMFLNEHQAKAAENELDRQLDIYKTVLKGHIDEMRLQGMSVENEKKLKQDLAKKVMEINATWDLAKLQAPANMLPTPPVEPPGRAPAGQSFAR